jgi:hypothetical protein
MILVQVNLIRDDDKKDNSTNFNLIHYYTVNSGWRAIKFGEGEELRGCTKCL